MLNWLSGMVVTVTALTPLATSTAQQLNTLPPQPSQDQIVCRNISWEKDTLDQVDQVNIHKKLSPYIKKMIREARTQQLSIRITSGYRTCTEQGSLRASACGLGDYNMYVRPISECTPPTEPAGRSLHNEGLAVDLSCDGYGVFAYSPCYQWLTPRAHMYQIKEHQLEPWHWSTTGK